MRLYLLRHSKAEKGSLKKLDKSRKLTSEGKIIAYKRAKKLANKLGDVDMIVSSPFPRALETAEIFASVLNKQDILNINDRLATSATPVDVIRLLVQLPNFQNILLVGHEPWMSQLASVLMCGHQTCNIELKKCGLMVLELSAVAPGKGTLVELR